MKKAVSGTSRPVRIGSGVILRPTSADVPGVAATPSTAKTFSNKVASPAEGGQALLQNIDRLQRKLIRDLS